MRKCRSGNSKASAQIKTEGAHFAASLRHSALNFLSSRLFELEQAEIFLSNVKLEIAAREQILFGDQAASVGDFFTVEVCPALFDLLLCVAL